MTAPTTPKAPETIARGGTRGRWTVGAVLMAVVVGVLSAGSVSSAVAADTCANAAVRAQTKSIGLPDCRAYEMVTSPYKEGFSTVLGGFTDDGLATYQTQGSFAGNQQGTVFRIQYHAARSPAGWITTSLAPPATKYTAPGGVVGIEIESVDLSRSLWLMNRRDVAADSFGYWLGGSGDAFTRIGDAAGVGPQPFLTGASADLSHIVFQYGSAGAVDYTALWEYVGTGNVGLPRAVAVDNQGQPSPFQTCPNDVSADGRVIVFTSACNGGVKRLSARVGGSVTVAVSGSECTRSADDLGGLCNGFSTAEYAGGAADGSRVFFTTSQQLVNGDVDSTNDLYACDIPAGVPAPVGVVNPCASLTQVSGSASNAQVDNVVAISDDGSRVYFVAQGVLADNLGLGDVGADASVPNLYMWERDSAHPAGQTRFVGRLAGGNDLARPQMTPDGRYLLFTTANSLVTTGPTADTDGARDVYRYDASTKTMVRISTSVSGGGGNAGLDASISEKFSLTSHSSMTSRVSAMTSDGSTVVFDSVEGLSGSDTNGVTDVYAWRDDGRVSLISAGGAAVAVGGGGNVARISPSGRDIFFTTNAPVLDSDRDVITDIYDARAGGGFAPSQTPSPCSGDRCQGLRTQAPSLPGPAGRGSGGREPVVAAPAFSLRSVSAAQRRVLAATGKVSLTVSANAAGTVGVRASASVGGRSVTVGSGRRVLTVPGKAVVALTLSKRARAQLAARGRLSVKVVVSHSKVALDRSVTLKLVRAKKPAKRGARS